MGEEARQNSKQESWLTPAMFWLSIVFLGLIASTLVLLVDVDRVVDPVDVELSADDSYEEVLKISEEERRFEEAAHGYGAYCMIFIAILWPFFIAEQVWNAMQENSFGEFRKKYPFWWFFVLFPPLRMCAQRREGETSQVWLPRLGWQTVDRKLRRKLERVFSLPMIWIALLILPVLGLQFVVFKDRIVEYPVLRILLHIGTGLIWFAFSVEFIVMVSVARSKLDYCKRHWLDLAIILLPFISFLRSVRALRATRLLNAGRLTQVSKMVRVYRLRGVAMRAFRALLVLEVLHRLLRTTPAKRIASLEKQRSEKLRELNEIEEQIAELKQLAERLEAEDIDEDSDPRDPKQQEKRDDPVRPNSEAK